MKKSTQQKLVVLFILLIFGMSTLAFVFLSIVGQTTPQEESIESPVVERELSPYLESLYIQAGVTFLRYYYTEKDDIYEYVGTLPGTLTAIDGSTQLVVERIQTDNRRLEIQSLYDNEDIDTLATEEIFLALCRHLISTPPECILQNSTL